jgi:hypothetical protein
VSIPPQLLNEQSLLTVLLIVATSTLFGLWRSAESDCRKGDREAATLLSDQRVLNERSLATINLRESERDQARKETERCERELDQWKQFPRSPERAP